MTTKKQSLYSLGALVLLLVLFAGIIMLSSTLLRGMRFDLTENGLYTLSDGTRNLLSEIQEPVNLYFFFSEDASRDLPQIRSYAKRVDELLEEFANHAGGKLTVERIDPKPFSEQEDEAAAFGLQGVPVGASGDSLYLGVAGTNTLDDVQAMPFLQPSKEKFLEYDLAKMVSTLGNPSRKTLGLLSTLDMGPGYDPMTQGMREAWVIWEQLNQLFEVQSVDPAADTLPEELDVLVVVHPKSLTDGMRYSIDQFVLGGGSLVAFMDPVAEIDRGDPNDPMARMQAGGSSTLGELLESWGVSFDTAQAVADLQFGVGNAQNRHIGILSVPAAGLNGEDIVSADLEVVNFTSAGWFSPAEGATTTFEALAQTSANAAPIDASRFRFLANPAELLDGFVPTTEQYALATRVSGPAASAFESPPEGADATNHMAESDESGINVLLFADVDMLSDRLWVQRQPFLGQSIVSAFADNGSLVVNAVDNMLGNRDLISIRTRASSGRPFERVSELQMEAERKYRATEENLQAELAETERKLTELQAAKEGSDLMVLSDEQSAELQRFVDRKLEIRRDLRQVQHDLQSDIEGLGTRLKLINIALVPALVMVAALLFAAHRRRVQDRRLESEEAA